MKRPRSTLAKQPSHSPWALPCPECQQPIEPEHYAITPLEQPAERWKPHHWHTRRVSCFDCGDRVEMRGGKLVTVEKVWAPIEEQISQHLEEQCPYIQATEREGVTRAIAGILWRALQDRTFRSEEGKALRDILKHEKKAHRRFVKRSRKLAAHLQQFRGFLDSLPLGLFSVANPADRLRAPLQQMADSLRAAVEDAPMLQGTRLEKISERVPHNQAAVEIYALLRRSSQNNRQLLESTATLLSFGFPHLEGVLDEKALEQAIRRASRHSGTASAKTR